ncbi:hypothetical protein OFR42_02565 [Brachyspira hyodysenteriae]|nr:hypothetical protein [Brachyspira hyodysenteriae]MDA0039554.1 hypothetical protein [Brachyspira hyodysenteriae]
MALSKPNEYNEVPAQQGEATVYAEDINQIISNIEKLKGGQANEAPISNIKELKERLDNLEQGAGSGGNINNISADKVSFNNDNANLDFFSEYDFPKFKNELKEIYEIKLITDYSINNVSHINDVQDVYNLTLEKSENKYILKGNLNYNNTSQYTSSLNFYIISINGNNDFGHIISEIYQFISSENNVKENEIVIEGLNNLKYNFGFLYAIPIFQIKNQDNSYFESKEYNITLNIEIENIKNNQEFIPINNAGEWVSFLNIQNINGKAVMKGELIKHSGSLAVFSHFALENYFDIKTDQNDGYYVESGSMITSNKNKSIKYYIRKELLDGSDLGTKYANIPITFYYLEIKHTDNTDIENEEILTFNLTAPKNADVPKIEKEKNIQNAIEILNDKLNSLIIFVGMNNYNFEIVSSFMGSAFDDNKVKDCSNLSLVKNADNSYSLKGNIEIYEDANSSSKMFIKTTKDIETDIKNIIAVIMTDNLMIMTLIFENYLYLNIQKMTETSVTNETFNNVKLIDNKIALFNNEIINKMSATKVSEDFGIVYEEGKYKIKGQLIFANGESNFSFYTNSGIIDFLKIIKNMI